MKSKWIKYLSLLLCATLLLLCVAGCALEQPDTSSDVSGETSDPSSAEESENPLEESSADSANGATSADGITSSIQKPSSVSSSDTTKAPTPAAGEAMQAVVTFG